MLTGRCILGFYASINTHENWTTAFSPCGIQRPIILVLLAMPDVSRF